jgi:hypothetical protein
VEFFSESNNELTRMADPDTLRKLQPGYYEDRFQQIADLRAMDDGSLHKGNEFRRVASLVNLPLMEAMKMLEPGFLKDKKTFYHWLDSGNNRQYCTYQRRRHVPGTVPNGILAPGPLAEREP